MPTRGVESTGSVVCRGVGGSVSIVGEAMSCVCPCVGDPRRVRVYGRGKVDCVFPDVAVEVRRGVCAVRAVCAQGKKRGRAI